MERVLITKMACGWQVHLTCHNYTAWRSRNEWLDRHFPELQFLSLDQLAPGVYWFKEQDDAVLFFLTWGGEMTK